MLAKNKHLGVHLARSDINFLPVKSGSVDVVSAFSVVHHIYQSDFLFKEVFRVLKPGGIFFADNDPNKLSTEIHDLNKQSALFRFLMGFYYLPLRFSKSFRERTRLLKELNKMLENGK